MKNSLRMNNFIKQIKKEDKAIAHNFLKFMTTCESSEMLNDYLRGLNSEELISVHKLVLLGRKLELI